MLSCGLSLDFDSPIMTRFTNGLPVHIPSQVQKHTLRRYAVHLSGSGFLTVCCRMMDFHTEQGLPCPCLKSSGIGSSLPCDPDKDLSVENE